MFNSEMIQNLTIGLEVTLYAMGGVFAVLIFFYLLVKFIVKLANRLQKKDTAKNEDV